MSEMITDAAIPDDVMREAIKAAMDKTNAHPGDWLAYSVAIDAALPILTPAIEKALLERMIADAHEKASFVFSSPMIRVMTHDHFWITFNTFLHRYLPTEDEEADT